MSDVWKNYSTAPIAEYRGIALFERPGDKRAVWAGHEYTTDGYIWLAWCHDEHFHFIGLNTEAEAKEFIDAFHDGKVQADLPWPGHFCGWEEFHQIIGRERSKPAFRWDEVQQVFTV